MTNDGTPCAMKVACTVWSRGKGEDYIKTLPIAIEWKPVTVPRRHRSNKETYRSGFNYGHRITRSRNHRRSPIFKFKREGIYVTLF